MSDVFEWLRGHLIYSNKTQAKPNRVIDHGPLVHYGSLLMLSFAHPPLCLVLPADANFPQDFDLGVGVSELVVARSGVDESTGGYQYTVIFLEETESVPQMLVGSHESEALLCLRFQEMEGQLFTARFRCNTPLVIRGD